MNFKAGNKVRFDPEYNYKHYENGIVKKVTENGVFVVYNCDNNWDKYQDYTAALTRPQDLKMGWKSK